MQIILLVIVLIALLIVIYQDVKMRMIHVFLPILILIVGFILNWRTILWMEVLYSALFLGLNFLCITLYFSIKKRQWLNPFDALIGWGDVLFLFAMIPFFSFYNYIVFFIMGTIFSLLLFIFFKAIYPEQKTVPFAGYLSIFSIGLFGISMMLNSNFLIL